MKTPKFIKLNDDRKTSIHENVVYWIAAVTNTDMYGDMLWYLNVDMMTSNGIKSMTLFYKDKEVRDADRIDLMAWMESKK